jgi:DNA-binding IscR family transcriptional regulator
LNPNFGITILNSLNVVKVSLTAVKDGAVRLRNPRHIESWSTKMPCALKISEAASLAMHALGYLAKREDGPITLREIASRFEISEAIEGRFEPSQCLLSSAICDGETCILGRILVEANNMLRERLEETTLVEVEAVINSSQ